MISCKKSIITSCFLAFLLPNILWAEAPVVDDSDNFAVTEQGASEAPLVNPKYDTPQVASLANSYPNDREQYEEQALVHEDAYAPSRQANPGTKFNNNAQLIEKVLGLQQEVQSLRGQLEVLTHDLKLLQQQQLSFYKDLDSRIGNTSSKSAPLDLSKSTTSTAPKVPVAPTSAAVGTASVKPLSMPKANPQVSRVNPADEQISYLAAYELIKNKRYDEGLRAMQVFAEKYPNSGYTANAEYWLGELYLQKKEYQQSIEHFEIVLKQFPTSSKSGASLLKGGYAYASLGDNQRAKARLQQVVANYPNTSIAQLAASKLETINAL